MCSLTGEGKSSLVDSVWFSSSILGNLVSFSEGEDESASASARGQSHYPQSLKYIITPNLNAPIYSSSPRP
jgi:hypothetical protein